MTRNETYWLPDWWTWMEDWGDCLTCLQHNHSSCVSCEIPPGVLALAQLVGGGTVAVAGSMRGNVGIASAQQAQAAARQHGAGRVTEQLNRQQAARSQNLQIDVDASQLNTNRGGRQ